MSLSSKKKHRIWERDKNICRYCGFNMSKPWYQFYRSVDHVIARVNGGTNDERDLVTSCKECNQKKGQREHPQIVIYKD